MQLHGDTPPGIAVVGEHNSAANTANTGTPGGGMASRTLVLLSATLFVVALVNMTLKLHPQQSF